jgi:hypothetical protein
MRLSFLNPKPKIAETIIIKTLAEDTLAELIDNNLSDKNTVHKYLGVYETLMRPKKETACNILEVGVWRGGSIRLWYDYFKNAVIFGLEHFSDKIIRADIKHNNRIKLYTNIDAYDETFFKNTFLNKGIKFDIIIDDGPHRLETIQSFVRLYSQLLTHDGILIVEDVKYLEWTGILKNEVPDNLKQYIKIFDLRNISIHQNSILFIIDKSIIL